MSPAGGQAGFSVTGEGSAGGSDGQRWARLWAAARPHDVPAGALGEYAALRAGRSEAAARRAYPAVAAHLAEGCEACQADLASLEGLLAEETSSAVAAPGGGWEPTLRRSLLEQATAVPVDFDALEAAPEPEPRGARARRLELREEAARRYEAETLDHLREEQERYLRQFQRAWEEAQDSLRAIRAAQAEMTGLARQASQPLAAPPPPAALATAGGGRPAAAVAAEPLPAGVSRPAEVPETLRAELAAIRAELASVQAATRSLRHLALASSGALLGAAALLAWLVLSQPRL